MSDWVAIPDRVVAQLGELLSYYGDTGVSAPATTDLPRVLVQGFIEYLSEDLGCDHGVNICTCREQEAAFSLTLALDGQQVCPRCHGEGFQDDEDGRPATCRSCFTSGVTRIDTDAKAAG